MIRRNKHEEISEIGTPTGSPSIWAAIRRKNEVRRIEKNLPHPPEVKRPPENWIALCTLELMVWAMILSTTTLTKFIF